MYYVLFSSCKSHFYSVEDPGFTVSIGYKCTIEIMTQNSQFSVQDGRIQVGEEGRHQKSVRLIGKEDEIKQAVHKQIKKMALVPIRKNIIHTYAHFVLQMYTSIPIIK